MDEIMQCAAAVAAEADTITLTACREGYYPREMEVTEIRVENLGTVWMKVRTDATSAIALRNGMLAGLCLRRGADSVTLTGYAVCVDGTGMVAESDLAGRGACTLRFTSEDASVWIDRQSAHYDFRNNG